jgi:hypothetical protein
LDRSIRDHQARPRHGIFVLNLFLLIAKEKLRNKGNTFEKHCFESEGINLRPGRR